MELKEADVVLCEFYFSDLSQSKKRPVLIFKDNLPYNDFVGIPISSKTKMLHADETIIEINDFKEGAIPVISKLMVRKTFIVSKKSVLKKYGTLNDSSYSKCHNAFCKYFGCQ